MRNLLVVDDERAEREGVRYLIEEYGLPLRTELRASGEDALEALREQRFDILLTDIKMPFMNGLELARQAKEIAPNLKIVIYSAYGEFDYAQQAIHLQVVQYLLKPVVVEDFLNVMRELIRQCDEEDAKQRREADLLEGYEQGQRYEQDKWLLDQLNGTAAALPRPGNPAADVVRLPYYMALIDYRTPVFDRANEAFRRVMEQQFGDAAYYLNLNECQSVLFVSAVLHDRQPEVWRPMWQALKDRIAEAFGEPVFLLVGGRTEAWEASRAELRRLEQLGEYKFFYDQSLVGHAADGELALSVPDAGDEPIEQTVDNVYAQIATDETGRIEDALDTLFYRLKRQSAYSNVYVKYICTEIVKRLFRPDRSHHDTSFDRYVNAIFQSQSLLELQDIVIGVLRSQSGAAPGDTNDNDKRAIGLILKIVHTQYMNDICLESVSRQVYLSPRYVSALFKKETGESFVKYVTEFRLNKAKAYLRDTNMKIKDIAEQVGYTDTSYFGMVFRRHFGVSPARFRESGETV